MKGYRQGQQLSAMVEEYNIEDEGNWWETHPCKVLSVNVIGF